MFLLSLVLAVTAAFPSNSKTSWMTPQSFRLVIGMNRADAEKTLRESGWSLKPGRNHDESIIDCAEDRALTLEYKDDRLRSVRFELFGMIPEVRKAFTEQKEMLEKEHGAPKKAGKSKSIIVYDDRLPNIMVVLSDDPESEYGKKGVGFLAVRYYDPVAAPAR